MEHSSPPPIPSPVHLPSDPTESALFDWSDFLDFDIDAALNTPFAISEPGSGTEQEPGSGTEQEPGSDQSQQSERLGRVRKRDPRLLCPNFVAGVVPCACPELDKKLEEEEESALPGKKRTRAVRAPAGGPLLCQVPSCEADISELKGYHKRHRVCLKCAHAPVVVLEGESKRYCQQCGKFHLLSNFDEGKRSCRRKLQKHNDRRRRKSNESKGGTDKEPQQVVLVDDVNEDDDDGVKDGTSPSSQMEEKEILLKSDGHISAVSSGPDSQGFVGEKVASFPVPSEIHKSGRKHSPNSKRATSYSDNFSSVCPTGRISFKLYDWNPAEFPRRLRLQIFEWLAGMPVELEGYIRPGCTILTAFIAMPKPMWLKLLDKPASCIKDLIGSPGSMLSGKGTMLVYVNDMIFRVTKDAHSVVPVSIKDRSPKLHYIYPTCFEAGRSMEFVACGSDLLQPKFRFLVSCDGRYLAYKIYVSSLCCKKGESNYFNHQLVKISVPQTDMNLSGPAFIEVENQSGLSNFVPIFFGDKETCEEMEILQRTFDTSTSCQEQPVSPPRPACGVLASRQTRFSGFLLDLGWSLKKPVLGKLLTSSDVQRFNYLLDFLIDKGPSVILERVFLSLESSIDKNDVAGVSDSDMRSLRAKMGIVRRMLDHGTQDRGSAVTSTSDGSVHCQSKDGRFVVQATKTGVKETADDMPWGREASSLDAVAATAPLVNKEVIMNVNIHTRPQKSPGLMSSRTFLTSRPLITAVAAVCICLGVCVALFHPQRVDQIAITIRRCLFDSPK